MTKKFAFLGPLKDEKVSSAIVHHGRIVYKDTTHSLAFEKAMLTAGEGDYEKGVSKTNFKSIGSGFSTSHGRIINRREATKMARKAGTKMRDEDYLHGDEVGNNPRGRTGDGT